MSFEDAHLAACPLLVGKTRERSAAFSWGTFDHPHWQRPQIPSNGEILPTYQSYC